jgi:hypothetical protein
MPSSAPAQTGKTRRRYRTAASLFDIELLLPVMIDYWPMTAWTWRGLPDTPDDTIGLVVNRDLAL